MILAVIGLLVLLGMGTAALEQSRLTAEEHDRLADRERVVAKLAETASVFEDPQRVAAQAATVPFAPGRPELNHALLGVFANSPTLARNRVAALLTPDGTVAANLYPGRPLPGVADLGVAWSSALAGRAAVSNLIDLDGTFLVATTAPIGGPKPWGVLVTATDNKQTQAFAGVFGDGLFKVDRQGVAVNAWEPNLVGTRLVDPTELAAVRTGTTRMWTTRQHGDRTTFLLHLVASTGYYTGLQRPDSLLYGDLWERQQQRNVTLAAVLASCLLGLTLFGFVRTRATGRVRARTDALLSETSDLVLVVDATSRALTFVGAAGHDLLGRDPQADVGRPLTDLVHPDDVARVQALIDDPARPPTLAVRLRTGTSAWRWFDVEASDLTGNQAVAGILVTCHEIGARKELADRLAAQAQRDALTGVANRAAVTAAIDSALAEAIATGASMSLLFIDLDRFKPVNDTYGHQVGDELLRLVARRISAAVRPESDRVGRSPPDALVGRLGGDEFAVLLHGATAGDAGRTARRIVDSLACPAIIGRRRLQVSASVGVSSIAAPTGNPHADISTEWLLRQADHAMYRAKRGGGNRWALADEDSFRPTPPRRPGPGARPARRGDGSDPNSWQDRRTATAAGQRNAGPTLDHDPTSGRGQPFALVRRAVPRVHTWATLMLPIILVAVVAGVAMWLERSAQQQAERARVGELAQLTNAAAVYSASANNLDQLVTEISGAPWTSTPSTVNQAVLRQMAVLAPNSVLALTDLDGKVVDSAPAGATLPVRPSDPAFVTAVGGRVGNEPVQRVGGTYWNYSLLPVLRDGVSFAVFALGEQADAAQAQLGYEALGSVGLGNEGGLSSLDVNGRARYSWDRALIGRRLADPAELATVPRTGAVRLPDAATTAQGTFAFAARDPALVNGGYVLFEVPASVALSGLRPGQVVRDLLLLVAVALTVFGLALATRFLEEADRRETERLSALLHNVHDIVVVMDRNGYVTFVSSAATRLLGYDTTMVPRRQLTVLHPDDRDRVRHLVSRPAGSAPNRPGAGTGTSLSDIRLQGSDGVYRWFDLHVSDQSSHPHIRGTLLTVHDVTDRRRMQDQLIRQARYDPLTSLPNRGALLDPVPSGDDAASTDRAPAAVLFVDLDRFKQVNDRLGHQAGDSVLSTVARRLVNASRPGDVVYRIGGDEFVVVLADATPDEAVAVARRLQRAVSAPADYEGVSIDVSVTVGVSLAEKAGCGLAELLGVADSAMYRAKRAGRGTVGVQTVSANRRRT
ncbi:diguanylate cyclase [Frankia sp. AgKG'84/4]|uniref:diguanylate cyclase n=1 Tax=Frankia sp. AgKG'84/4 TaxID=573490 RepID=UPI00200DF9B3|nr:diguanylate cyclase [Frankia sp. AgKG'84/4]MCL9793206.1 diguanylate cyclase [Frankia sp. AgKG'84/4]